MLGGQGCPLCIVQNPTFLTGDERSQRIFLCGSACEELQKGPGDATWATRAYFIIALLSEGKGRFLHKTPPRLQIAVQPD